MSKIELRRRRIARLLLIVFITMTAFTMLHRHPEVKSVDSSCELCISHIRHSGHWSAEHFSLQPCLLCELASLPFLQGAAPAFMVAIDTRYFSLCADVFSHRCVLSLYLYELWIIGFGLLFCISNLHLLLIISFANCWTLLCVLQRAIHIYNK